MIDREKKIAEIREALEKATPGPWVYDDIFDDIYADKTDVIVCYTVGPEDGRLIANAPEWLRFLLSELDKRDECTKENPCRECLKMSVDGYKEIVRELEDENRKLRKERDKLIEALRWYAETVGSQRARNILREIGVTVE